MNQLYRNIRLFYIANFFSLAEFYLPIMVLFGTQYLGLSLVQIGLLMWIKRGAYTIFDFFGGIIADRFGRKLAYTLGTLLEIISFVPFVCTKSYSSLLLAFAVGGVGKALASSSLDALLYEQTVSLNAKPHYQKTIIHGFVLAFTGRAFASIVGGFAFVLSPVLPFWLMLAALMVSLVAGTGMKFPPHTHAYHQQKNQHWKLMRAAMHAYLHNGALLKFVTIYGILVLLLDTIFNLYQPFYIALEVSPQMLGFIMGAIAVVAGVGSLAMRTLSRKYSVHVIQSAILVGGLLTAIALLLFPMPLVLVAPLFMAVSSGWRVPNMQLFVNHHTPNKVRASVLSLATTVGSLGTSLAILIAYFSIEQFPVAYLLSGIVIGLLLTLALNSFWHKKQIHPANMPASEGIIIPEPSPTRTD